MPSIFIISGIKLITVACLLVVMIAGCSSTKTPRYPEDHARFGRIVEAVESLRQAYIDKDEPAARELFLPLDNLKQLGAEIQQDFRIYSHIALDLSIERIMIRDDQIQVNFRWQGEWAKERDTPVTHANGHGILHWTGTQVILLADVEGDIPFGMASRQSIS